MKTLDYLHLDENAAGKLVQSLQQLLADFQVHYMNLRGFHWNIKGHGFFVLHTKFEELYDDAAEKVDQIAERILQLGGVPSNKFSEYLKVAKIAEVDHVSCGGSRTHTRHLRVSDRGGAQGVVGCFAGRRRSDGFHADRLPGRTGENGLDAHRIRCRQVFLLREIVSGSTK